MPKFPKPPRMLCMMWVTQRKRIQYKLTGRLLCEQVLHRYGPRHRYWCCYSRGRNRVLRDMTEELDARSGLQSLATDATGSTQAFTRAQLQDHFAAWQGNIEAAVRPCAFSDLEP